LAELPGLAQAVDVLTYHNDNGRTGQNLNETRLTPANVNSSQFGLLRVLATDGKVDAQVLCASGISIPGQGQRNVVFVATEHDTVYAFDADSGSTFWKVSLFGSGETPSDNRGCSQVSPEIGITSTPVIDRYLGPNGTLFVVAMSKSGSGQYFQRLHALDLATGVDEVTPVTISATYPGTGANSSGGNVIFDPAQYEERAALLLLNGVVYTAWSSHCDDTPYTGWIIGYDETTLAQTSVLNITPNGTQGAIWMSGDGLAADSGTNIYFLAGNGTFDTSLNSSGFPANQDFGNAFMKLSTGGNVLAVADYFATYNTPSENNQDVDLGSGGALVLPDMTDSQGVTQHLAVGAGKDQNIYLVDRSNMGKFNSSNDNAIYQELVGALPGGVWAMPAYFNGTLYYGSVGNPLKAFAFQNAHLASSSSHTPGSFGYPGTTPSISANGNANGIVWAPENSSPAVLHAFAATDLGTELYNSNQAQNGRDHFGSGNKFITPTIANGQVYVGTTSGVGVFGLLNQAGPTISLTSPSDGASYPAPANIDLAASVTANGHTITKVQFYNSSSLLGESTGAPYTFTWSNVSVGSYTLTARLVYDSGSTLDSSLVNITVTSVDPTITLTSPSDGASYPAPANINLAAGVTANGHTITKVQFYNSSSLLGESTGAPYTFTWSNVSVGSYTLTARLVYDSGSTLDSSSVNVTVTSAAPTVALTSPSDGATYKAPATISIAADVASNGHTISKIQFYNGSSLLAEDTIGPYTFTWSNVGVGSYTLTARVVYDSGSTLDSSPVTVAVRRNNSRKPH
jgi:predicted double-glycine peptidase